MRDQSLSLRILVLAVLLLVVAAACVAILVVAGILNPRPTYMAIAGAAILIVATLGAAISALGPKYRPTPLLTPLFAGVLAAFLATVAIYAAHAHFVPNRAAVASAEVKPAAKPAKPAKPPKTMVQPVKAETDKAPVAPDLAAAPPPPPAAPAPAAVPSFDPATFTPPAANAEAVVPAAPAAAADVQPAMAEVATPKEPAGAATAKPAAETTPVNVAAVAPPTQAADKAGPADGAKKPPVAAIPLPAAAPDKTARQSPDQPVNLTSGFDPSGPVAAEPGAPMALDAADVAAVHHAAIPPLPRIRPCGGAGPACP